MKYSEKHGLFLPDYSDNFDIQTFNDNTVKIDEIIAGIERHDGYRDNKISNAEREIENLKVSDAIHETKIEDEIKKNDTLRTRMDKATSAMTAILSTSVASLGTTADKQLSCGSIYQSSGKGLTCSSGGVKIGEGISRVAVFGQVYYTTGIVPGNLLGAAIYRNDTVIIRNYVRAPFSSISRTTTTVSGKKVLTSITFKASEHGVTLSPTICSCKKGDIFRLYAKNASAKTGNIEANSRTRITVIALE